MSAPDPIEGLAAAAFRALQVKAHAEHSGNTQGLLVVYAVESFLRRLAISQHAQRMVLKGGMLMAVNAIRRMTKDADLSTHGLANDQETVWGVVAEICGLSPVPHDGVVIDPATIKTEVMRDDDEYQGVRVKLVAGLDRAKIPFALDFSFGDPRTSTTIMMDSVIDRPAFPLQAYPFVLNLAEKIVTAMQRREVSTRDRDFADLWVASRSHRLDARKLRSSVDAVAGHRQQPVISLAEALRHMPDRQTSYAGMVERMAYSTPPPQQWTDLIAGVIEFIDPLLGDDSQHLTAWDPGTLQWT